MLARFSRFGGSSGNNKVVPLAIGATAVVLGAYLLQRNSTSSSAGSNTIQNEGSKIFIGDGNWIDLPISKIEDLSHDTRRFTFKLPTPDAVTGLELASALFAKFVTPKGSNVIRPYTPVSELSQQGDFQLVIKRYPEGKMTNHLFSLKTNDTVSFKGPIKKFPWTPNTFDSITLIGGGTGITPLFQLIRHIVPNKDDHTKVTLLYANKTPQDILLKHELDELQAKYPDKLKITYFVDKVASEDNFTGEKGFITKEYITQHAAKPSEKTHVFVCGPPGLMDAYSGQKSSPQDQGELTGVLKELGYTKDQVFKY